MPGPAAVRNLTATPEKQAAHALAGVTWCLSIEVNSANDGKKSLTCLPSF